MFAIEPHQPHRRQCDQHDQDDEQDEVGDEARTVEGRFSGGVEMRTDDVAYGLTDEEDGGVSFLLGLAGGVLGGPGVD